MPHGVAAANQPDLNSLVRGDSAGQARRGRGRRPAGDDLMTGARQSDRALSFNLPEERYRNLSPRQYLMAEFP